MNTKFSLLLVALLALSFDSAPAATIGTGFTYQGRLSSGTGSVTGSYDLTFSIWDAAVGVGQVGNTLTNAAVGVTNGFFTVTLDLGSGVFDGNALWLEIGVRTNGSGPFVTLNPRQALAAAPYAQYAPSAGAAGQASSVTAGAITTAMLANGAVTSTKLGAAAVKPSNIDDGGNAVYQGFVGSAGAMDSTAPLPYSTLSLVSASSPAFTFTLDDGAFGTVVSFTGHEGMSEPYTYVVGAIAAPALLNPNVQMGRQGRLTFVRGGRATTFAGLVTGCSVSAYDGESDLYLFRLESPLAYLALNTGYQIYQDQDVPTIVSSLYRDLTVYNLSNVVSATYPRSEHSLQYAETALNFFHRQLETEGIFYFFGQDGRPPVLILGDSPSAYGVGNISTFLYYGDTVTNTPEGAEFIRSFQKAARESTLTSVLNAYDFTKPNLNLTAGSSSALGQGTDYQFGTGIPLPSVLNARVTARKERQQVQRLTFFGTANGPDLRAGYTFTLNDQTGSGEGNTYLVTSVQHAAFRRSIRGAPSFYYGNQFEVIPSSLTFRPPSKTPKPVALPCTARVTGAAGEEVHTDKYGRVKVKFRWDRSSVTDDTSSAWIRVASPWAGAGRGMLFLPRVGDEVLVSFVQGDPDQPVVTSSFYNAVNVPAYSLPASQTRSYIKTESSPGGGGANEIRFEDKKGAEELFINATKDFNINVSHDLNLAGGHDLMINSANNVKMTGTTVELLGTQGVGVGGPPSAGLALNVNGTLGATYFQGDGAGLANLSAPALTGVVDDARLSVNIPRLNSSQTFSGNLSLLGRVGIGGAVGLDTLTVAGTVRLQDNDLFLRGNNGDTAHGLGWYGGTKPFGASTVDGPVLYGCGGGALGTICAGLRTALVWNNAGNVGIGVDVPGTRLEVSGTVRAMAFAGDGAAVTNLSSTNLTGVISASRLPSNVALLSSSASFAGAVTTPNVTVSGDARVTGVLRSGSETGSSQAPNPAGLVIRRINSIDRALNQVLARTDVLTLERDGTKAGLIIRYPANAGAQTINALGISNTGALVPVHLTLNNATSGTVQLFSDAQRVAHAQISFGNTYNSGAHVTQVILDRFDDGSASTASGDDFYWMGTLTSTYNQ